MLKPKIYKPRLFLPVAVFFISFFLSSCSALFPFLKKEKITAEVCVHKWGCDISLAQTSDRYIGHRLGVAAEFYGLKHNIPLTVFDLRPFNNELNDIYKMGRMDFGVYLNSCGEDFNTKPMNQIEQTINCIKRIREGNQPVVLSYGCGIDDYRDRIKHLFLMGRNSKSSNDTLSFVDYNSELPFCDTLAKISLISRPSTTRYFQMVNGKDTNRIEKLHRHIKTTIEENGFFTDFSHWHAHQNYRTPIDELSILFQNIEKCVDSVLVYRGSFNDVAEYYFARRLIDSVYVESNKQEIILHLKCSKKDSVNYELVQIPASIYIDLKESKLRDFDFTSKKGANIYKSDNKIMVDVNIQSPNKNWVISDTLSITDQPGYLDFSVPNLKIIGKSVLSDQEVKLTVFKRLKNQDDTKTTIEKRYLDWSKEHLLTEIKKQTNFDYYIGFINYTGNSGLIEWK